MACVTKAALRAGQGVGNTSATRPDSSGVKLSTRVPLRAQASAGDVEPLSATVPRRAALMGALAAIPLVVSPQEAQAVMGMTAGRVPGLAPSGREGYEIYTRPEGKSGGHGIGWSEIPQYRFTVPTGWEERAVSIADLGGTEIDIRFENKDQGELAVVVAPVLRFMDVGFNAQVTMKDVGEPEQIISGFAPELWGQPLGEDDVLDTQILDKDGEMYYRWEVKPYQKSTHLIITATATRNRLFIMLLGANPRQWRKAKDELAQISESFFVPPATA